MENEGTMEVTAGVLLDKGVEIWHADSGASGHGVALPEWCHGTVFPAEGSIWVLQGPVHAMLERSLFLAMEAALASRITAEQHHSQSLAWKCFHNE